jgi:hypothetical protein
MKFERQYSEMIKLSKERSYLDNTGMAERGKK